MFARNGLSYQASPKRTLGNMTPQKITTADGIQKSMQSERIQNSVHSNGAIHNTSRQQVKANLIARGPISKASGKEGSPSNSAHNSVFTSTSRMNVNMKGSRSSRNLGYCNDRRNPAAEVSVTSITSQKKTTGLRENIRMQNKKSEKRTPCLKIDLHSSSLHNTATGMGPSGMQSRSTHLNTDR